MSATVSLIALLRRRPDLDHNEFRNYYERVHAPLIRANYSQFFQSYWRSYVDPADHVLGARPAREPVDVITRLTFVDRDHLNRMFEHARNPKLQQLIRDDEAKFLDQQTMVFHITSDES